MEPMPWETGEEMRGTAEPETVSAEEMPAAMPEKQGRIRFLHSKEENSLSWLLFLQTMLVIAALLLCIFLRQAGGELFETMRIHASNWMNDEAGFEEMVLPTAGGQGNAELS